MSVAITYPYIVHTSDILGGEARIDGWRIRVRDIVAARDVHGHTPEEIASGVCPELTLAQVYSALAYYEDHHEEIDRAQAEERRVIEEFKAWHGDLVAPACSDSTPAST